MAQLLGRDRPLMAGRGSWIAFGVVVGSSVSAIRCHARLARLRTSRSRIVEQGLRERRRMERDLHDGAQARLVALALTLRHARLELERDRPAAEALLDRSVTELELAMAELRRLARGIHPAMLTSRGLGPAVAAVAERAPLPVKVTELPGSRLPERVEATAYFIVSEGLANVVKHAAATRASVKIAREADGITVEVSDDGVGGAGLDQGTGLAGLAYRVEAVDGELDLRSARGQGTRLRARIPVA